MTAVDLPPPAIADFDFSVTRRGAVADYKMVGQAVAHSANVVVVIVEDAGITLPGAAVVNDDELPALPQHWGAINFRPDGTAKKLVVFPKKMKRQKRKAAWLLKAGFGDNHLRRFGGGAPDGGRRGGCGRAR